MFPLIKLQSISFMLHRSSCREMKQILLATNNEMTGLKSMGKVGELKKKISRTRNIKILLRAQFWMEGSMEGVSHFQGKSGASSVCGQFFLAFLSFPKGKKKHKTENSMVIYTM